VHRRVRFCRRARRSCVGARRFDYRPWNRFRSRSDTFRRPGQPTSVAMIVERLKRICPWGMAGLIPLFVACGDGPTDPSPTVHRLSVGATVEGNLRAGEVVTYEIDAERGTPLRILLLARSGRRSDNLVAEVVAVTQSGFDPITHVFSRGADTVLEDQASDWFTVPDVGTYQVRVRGATGADG